MADNGSRRRMGIFAYDPEDGEDPLGAWTGGDGDTGHDAPEDESPPVRKDTRNRPQGRALPTEKPEPEPADDEPWDYDEDSYEDGFEDDEFGYEDEDDDVSGDDLPDTKFEDLGAEASTEYMERHREFYDNYEYDQRLTPRIPAEYRGVDVLGLRSRANGTVGEPFGNVTNKRQLREIWDGLSPVQKYILMLISEHRHLTQDQLYTFVVLPGYIRRANETQTQHDRARDRLQARLDRRPTEDEISEELSRIASVREGLGRAKRIPARDVMRSYTEWLFHVKYGQEISPKIYKAITKTNSRIGLERALTSLVKLGLIVERDPSYKVRVAGATSAYADAPSLFTQHYYLKRKGAHVLVANTKIKGPSGNARTRGATVGYVENHMDAPHSSIVHETECTECLVSLVRCAQYASNVEVFSPDIQGDTDFGYIDVCRCFHEKDCEEKRVDWRKTNGNKGIDFKSDGLVTLWSSRMQEFIDLYLEYDAGSSTENGIGHKIEAYIKYTLAMREKLGPRFRRPIMLLVSQSPASWMTSMARKETSTYTSAIHRRVSTAKYGLKPVYGQLNEIACVLVTDCNAMRQHGALGACWHRMDIQTGVAEPKARDLLSLVSEFAAGK